MPQARLGRILTMAGTSRRVGAPQAFSGQLASEGQGAADQAPVP